MYIFRNNKIRYTVIFLLSICFTLAVYADFIYTMPLVFLILGFFSITMLQLFVNTIITGGLIPLPIFIMLIAVGGISTFAEKRVPDILGGTHTLISTFLVFLGMMLFAFFPMSFAGYLLRRFVLYIQQKRRGTS